MTSADTLGDQLGEGAFGKATGALKSIDISGVCDHEKAAKKKEWKQEVRALMKVHRHENIVVYTNSFASDDNKLWVEMEYCNGGTLNDYVIEKNPSKQIKQKFLVEISSGVAFLHEQDIWHQDLKPETVMICIDENQQPHAKVSDFGFAKILASYHYGGKLMQYYLSSGCGTEYFIAPEVYDGDYSEKADVFSMGILFFALIIGPITKKIKDKKYLIFYDGTHGMIGKYFHKTKSDYVYYRAFEGMFEENVLKLLDSMIQYQCDQRPSAEEVNTSLQSILPKE